MSNLRLTSHDPLPYRVRTTKKNVEFDAPDHTPEIILLAAKAALLDALLEGTPMQHQPTPIEFYDYDNEKWVVLPR